MAVNSCRMVCYVLWIMLMTAIDPELIVFLLCTYCEHYCAFMLGLLTSKKFQ